MKAQTKILLIAALILFSNAGSFAQGIGLGSGKSQKTENRPEEYTHFACGFRYPSPGRGTMSTSIDYSSYRGLGQGMINQYWSTLARYDIGCIDLDDPPRKMKKDELISVLNSKTKEYLQDSFDLTALPNASVNTYEFETKGDFQRRIKYVLEGNRVYIFIAGAYGAVGIDEALKLFGAVKYFSIREFAEKSMQAAIKALPQTPAVRLAQTDAVQNNLKGRVKSVRVEAEDMPVLVGAVVRRLKSDETYDRTGNLLKDFWFQDEGYPTSVTVYGFIDGARVAKSEDLDDEGGYGVIIGIGQGSVELPPEDPRFNYRYEYKYDAAKRLIEKKQYNNRGKVESIYTFTYKADLTEEKRFDGDGGKLISTKRRQLDKSGNVLKYEFWWYEETDIEEETYTYKKFDRFGNWTERQTVAKIAERGLTRIRTSNEIRTITYYEK